MNKSFLTIILLISFRLGAQTNVDSLQALLENKSLDRTKRVDILNHVSVQTRRSNYQLSLQCAREALKLSKENNYRKGEGEANVNIGMFYNSNSELFKSLECGHRAVNIFEELSDKKGLMDAYLLLGVPYTYLKEWEKAEKYLNLSLNLGFELKDNNAIARAYNYLGTSIIKKSMSGESSDEGREKGKQFYLKALSYLQDDNSLKAIVLANLGGSIFLYEDSIKARTYLIEALKLAESSNDLYAQTLIHERLGNLFSKTNFDQAEYHLIRAESIAKQSGDKTQFQAIYIDMMSLKMDMGDAKGAHAYQKKYAQTRDSIFNAEKAQQIAELETRLETEAKEKEIQLLQQEKEIQKVWRNVLIAGTILAGLGAYLIFLLQRSRTRKTKKLLEFQQLLNDKLKEVDALKSSFFANISHEFRTPLTLILAPLENELKKKSSVEGRESLLLMRRSADRLLDLINQLLDLSKLESGKMNMMVKRGDISQFLSVIVGSFDSLAQQKQIEFVKDIRINEEEHWYDQDKIEKIITNLLSNAFKYTPSNGTITIAISTNQNNRLSIVVSDTGAGIPKEDQTNVFLPFYQTRQSTNYQQGTGLGLSLVRELIKLYNGTIELVSTPGLGTSFSVVIPINKEEFTTDQIIEGPQEDFISHIPYDSKILYDANSIETEQTEALLEGRDSVLIVEDNTDMREFMSATLQKNNYTVYTASDGQEALPIALKFIPSLVLSDLMMPHMDGIELTEKIKVDERTSHIPVILLTAKSESQSRIKGLKTGADDYLTKPFSPDELLVRISNLIEQRKKLAEKFRERILVSASPSNELSLDDRFLTKVRTIVESNLSDYTFTVEKLAEEISLSRTQLLRKLKALTGLSPTDFIKDIRMKHAADMIRQRVDTITQIGYAVGFNDQSYFTKCFKRQFGMTPSEFSLEFSKKKEVGK